MNLKLLRAEGYHFRKQAPFRGFVLDFVCYSRKLVIEVDGASHDTVEGIERDMIRDAVLRDQGFHVMRFWNAQIDGGVEFVMLEILERLRHLPHPDRLRRSVPPHEEEG